jgi:DNA-binding response OmpR family regulator
MNKKVLIVDDDKVFLSELKEMLNLSGYDVVEVDNPEDVCRIAFAERPDIILLDINMPQKSGFQVIEEMNNIAELDKIPVLIISAYFKDIPPGLIMRGTKIFLPKPFHPLDVIAEIEKNIL